MQKNTKISLKDVAKMAGVYPSAVSVALNNKSYTRISAEKREYIQKIAKEMGYCPNIQASSLRRKRKPEVGIFVPSWRDTLLYELISGISESAVAYELPLSLHFGFTFDTYNKFIESMTAYRNSGLISYVPYLSERQSELVEKLNHYQTNGGKIITINHNRMDAHINSDFGDLISVGIDEVWGGKLAAEYFLEHPCDSYVAIGLDSAVRKAKGFRQVMDEAGEKIRVIEISHHESDYIKILVKKFDELTKNNKKTIGIFSMTGSFENYIISRSLERSLSVGECVNIVAYGNEPRYGEYLPIPRIIQPFQQLGKMAMKKMKNILIGNKEKSAWLKPDIVVPLIK